MSKLFLLLWAGFWCSGIATLFADDFPPEAPLSHNPADYQFWGAAVAGLSVGVHVIPIPSTQPWTANFRFQILIKNESAKTVYAYPTSEHLDTFQMFALDSLGHEHLIRGTSGDVSPVPFYTAIQPGGSYFKVLYLQQTEFKAIGGNSVILIANLGDTSSRTDPQIHKTTVRTAPFQFCPTAPVQATLPDDPMMVLWKQNEADLLDKISNATGPNDRSEEAETLAYFYIDCYGDFDKARAMLTQITDPIDNFDARLMLVTRNTSLTAKQQVEGLEALVQDCPPKRQAVLESMITQRKYAADHPPDQK